MIEMGLFILLGVACTLVGVYLGHRYSTAAIKAAVGSGESTLVADIKAAIAKHEGKAPAAAAPASGTAAAPTVTQ